MNYSIIKILAFVGTMTLPFYLQGKAPVAQVGQQTAPTPVSLQFSGRKISSPVEMTYRQPSSRELKSFMGVAFGESIHQAKFSKLEEVLDGLMKAECKVDNAFGLFKSANVFAASDGKIHRIWRAGRLKIPLLKLRI